jgi:hypothetical protein
MSVMLQCKVIVVLFEVSRCSLCSLASLPDQPSLPSHPAKRQPDRSHTVPAKPVILNFNTAFAVSGLVAQFDTRQAAPGLTESLHLRSQLVGLV